MEQTTIETHENQTFVPIAVPLDMQSEPIVCVANACTDAYTSLPRRQTPSSPEITQIQVYDPSQGTPDIENNIRVAHSIDEYEYNNTRLTPQRILMSIVICAGVVTLFAMGIKNW